MGSAADDGHNPHVENTIRGRVKGTAVQAGSIRGGVHFDQSRIVYQTVYVDRQRKGSPLDALWGLLIMASGGVAAAAIPGLFNVVTGQVFAARLPWLLLVPWFVPIGAMWGLVFALLTRRRLLTRLRRRIWIFVMGGGLILPLTAVVPSGQGHVSVIFFFSGAVSVLVLPLLRGLWSRRH